uniref:Uncharacterized protein n=1 Tax=Glossina austeni TaxID=7395 RepID=A0A1A9UNC5_GLOAU
MVHNITFTAAAAIAPAEALNIYELRQKYFRKNNIRCIGFFFSFLKVVLKRVKTILRSLNGFRSPTQNNEIKDPHMIDGIQMFQYSSEMNPFTCPNFLLPRRKDRWLFCPHRPYVPEKNSPLQRNKFLVLVVRSVINEVFVCYYFRNKTRNGLKSLDEKVDVS